MGIIISSQFSLQAQLPLDDRAIQADLTARNAIGLIQRYFGLEVILTSDGSKYMLADAAMGGTDSDLSNNANWIPAGGSGGGLNFETPSGTIDGSNDTFTVLHTPKAVVLNGAWYFENDGYTLSGLTITMLVIPETVSTFRSAY